jgi:MGT family glycosyltransferase
VPEQPVTVRAHDPEWDHEQPPLPRWWGDDERPLVYITFGSVAGGMPMAELVYGAALAAVADLPARVLVTTGHEGDLDVFADAPPHVHVERWVPQAQVLEAADVMVCHGGSGSTLGALAAGVPMVVVPLFADQPLNAERVAAVEAGVVVPPDPGAIAASIRRVLDDPAFRHGASAVAVELRRLPTVDEAVEVLGLNASRRGGSPP